MNEKEVQVLHGRLYDDANIRKQIDLLIEQYPRMVDKGLINSREIIEASDKLSSGIIEGFRQRLAL